MTERERRAARYCELRGVSLVATNHTTVTVRIPEDARLFSQPVELIIAAADPADARVRHVDWQRVIRVLRVAGEISSRVRPRLSILDCFALERAGGFTDPSRTSAHMFLNHAASEREYWQRAKRDGRPSLGFLRGALTLITQATAARGSFRPLP